MIRLPPKMHTQTKFGIPTLKNIGGMHRHEAGRKEGRTLRMNSAITIVKSGRFGHQENRTNICKQLKSRLTVPDEPSHQDFHRLLRKCIVFPIIEL